MVRSALFAVSLALFAAPSSWAQAPLVLDGGAVNGASFRPAAAPGTAVAPGSIISIFGKNLAASTSGIQADALPLPTSLAGTSVTIGGLAAPLFFVRADQINAVVPWSVTSGTVQLLVKTAAGSSTM